MIYFTRGLGIAPGVGDIISETHIDFANGTTQSFFYIQNHRGDTVALIDESGEVVGTYEYNAWGEIVAHSGQDAYFTFSSKHFDEDAKLYYYGFRWYDPVTKRWTQPDPSGLDEGLDLYRFCDNDPVNLVDVYGLWVAADIGRWTFNKLGVAKDYYTSLANNNVAAETVIATIYDIATLPVSISAGISMLGDNSYDRYQYNVCELNNNPFYAVIDAVALTMLDLVPVVGTKNLETYCNVDRVSGEKLTWDERTARYAATVTEAVLVGFAVKAMKTGYIPSAKSFKLYNKKWSFGSYKSTTKWENQMSKRGWSQRQISEALQKGKSYPAKNYINKGNTATRYVHPQTGKSVVIDTITKEIIHIGDHGYKY